MFISYEYQKYLGYDKKTKLYSYQYKIIDSNFEAEGITMTVAIETPIEGGVIQEYNKRNLNVAANLVRAFQYSSKKYGHSINEIIEWNRKYNPEFHKYEKELEKYLTLI